MKIITYNVNGIRSALSKGLTDWLAEELPDVLCLQETKANPNKSRPKYSRLLDINVIFIRQRKKDIAALLYSPARSLTL